MHELIRLSEPSIGIEESAAVERVLQSGRLVMGPEVAGFEGELGEYLGVPHVIATSSGTAALHAVLAAMGIGVGSRVAVPAFSWVATANAVSVLGAVPVFVDIDSADWCMSTEGLRSTLAELSIDAVMPVHTFGYVAEMEEILSTAERAGVPVVEDAACALGANYEGSPAGTLGLAGCFSFHPRKVITTGEGGAVCTEDAGLAEEVRRFINHGQSAEGSERFPSVGINYRMTEVSAAIGRVQLSRLPELIGHRREVVAAYRSALDGSPIKCQPDEFERSVHQTFAVELPSEVDRSLVMSRLRDGGIEASIGTIAITNTAAHRNSTSASFPNTDRADRSLLALPLHGRVSTSKAAEIADCLVATLSAAPDTGAP